MNENSHIVSNDRALDFIVAGNAKFTLIGKENRFTYKVIQPKFEGVKSETMRFVKVMDSKRANDLTYIGLLKLVDGYWEYHFRVPKKILNSSLKPAFNPASPEVVAIDYAMKVYQHEAKKHATSLELWHEGCCACCGRSLTVPETIAIGWGHHCLKKLKAKEFKSETQQEFEAR